MSYTGRAPGNAPLNSAGITDGTIAEVDLDAALSGKINDKYTQAELNAGQLDSRYYTEVEIDTKLAELPELLTADVQVTVGAGGDFSTINSAIEYLTKEYTPTYRSNINNFKAEIMLLSGFVIAEQVIVSGIDLGWITLSSQTTNVLVNRSALTVNTGLDYGTSPYAVFSAIKGGKFPLLNNFTIDGQVALGSGTPNDGKSGYFCAGSGSSITGIGTIGALQMSGAACFAYYGGTISAYTMTNSSNSGAACYAYSGGTISANTMTNSSNSGYSCFAHSGGTISSETVTNSSNSNIACYVISGTISSVTMTNSSDSSYACFARAGTISAYTMVLSNSATSTTYLAYVLGGGEIISTAGTWTNNGSGSKANVAAATLTSAGYINRIG